MTDLLPVSIEKTPARELLIEWSDGRQQRLKFRALRDACPCATCMEKRMGDSQNEPVKGQLTVLSPAQTMPLEILSMRPVGNYAYNIRFSDGHTSGLFTLELLRQL